MDQLELYYKQRALFALELLFLLIAPLIAEEPAKPETLPEHTGSSVAHPTVLLTVAFNR